MFVLDKKDKMMHYLDYNNFAFNLSKNILLQNFKNIILVLMSDDKIAKDFFFLVKKKLKY
jgi:hypothetical protein